MRPLVTPLARDYGFDTFPQMLYCQPDAGGTVVAIESSGHSRGNPRQFELIEDSPKTGASPTVWAWPQLIEHLKVASQPVQGPWPPHQERRPDPDAESLPVAIPDPQSANDNS